MWDNFRWPIGVETDKPLGEEAWFEHRYPNLLEDARLRFIGIIDKWVQSHWGESQFLDQRQRITVYARDQEYANADGTKRKVTKNDDRFERCGDKPQNPVEADQLLGAFSLDLETPITITYSRKSVRGRMVNTYEWTAVMYVSDVLGLQKNNNAAQWPLVGRALLWSAPSRRVTRARWKIHADGVSALDAGRRAEPVRMHKVMLGDTLSKLAQKYYDDAGLWPILYAVNRDAIGNNPNLLRTGQSLHIPDLDDLSPSEKARAMTSAPSGAANTISMPPLR